MDYTFNAPKLPSDYIEHLRSLNRKQLNILNTTLNYVHKCSGSQVKCCDKLFCESCYVQHINTTHPKTKFHAERLYTTNRLITSNGLRQTTTNSDPSHKPKRTPKLARGFEEMFSSLEDEQLERLWKHMQKQYQQEK